MDDSRTSRNTCPCGGFRSLSDIVKSLDDASKTEALVHWITGRAPACHGQEACEQRAIAIVDLLNGLRDTCGSFLESNRVKKASDQQPPSLGDTSQFPSLAAASTVQKKRPDKKCKRRIRPITTTTTVTLTANSAFSKGNLVGLPDASMSEDPFPALSSLHTKKPAKTKPIVSATTTTSSWGKGHSAGSTTTSAVSDNPIFAAPTNHMRPRKEPPQKAEICPILAPIPTTPESKRPTIALQVRETENLRDDLALNHLVDLYSALLENYLVQSSVLEVHWLLRLLTIGTGPMTQNNSRSDLSCVLSTGDRCVYFAKCTLKHQSNLLTALVVAVPGLAGCRPLLEHVPELKERLQLQLGNAVHSVELSVDHTALLTLPFNEKRDSRHNYRTPELQAIYKNREETRDAFLYQLRAFLDVRGKRLQSDTSEMHKIRQSFRVIVNGLRDSNYPWFAEFFCDMLLQLGHVPIQETDSELLRITDKDKLQKLHRRFSSKVSRSSRSNRAIATSSDQSASPVAAAQQLFPGHQEFFFMFLVSSDSYVFSMHLRALLVDKIKNVDFLNEQEMARKARELTLFARFLGYIVFSPNWRKLSENDGNEQAASLNGIEQLAACGLSLARVLHEAAANRRLLPAVSWVVELLKMGTWDSGRRCSTEHASLLALLRRVQITTTITKQPIESVHGVLVSLFLESLFACSMSVANLVRLPSDTKFDTQCTNVSVSGGADELSGFLNHLGTTNVGLSSNIEDLAVLVSELSRSSPAALKSPGISRKLRPSSIDTLSPKPNRSLAKFDSGTSGSISLTSSTDSTFQSKLRDSFFHQHGHLKNLCEFAVSEGLKLIYTQLRKDCLRPFFERMEVSLEQTMDDERPAVMSAAIQFLKAKLRTCVEQNLFTFAATEVNQPVLDVAIALSVDYGVEIGKQFIVSAIEEESHASKQLIMRTERKRLFPSANNSEPLFDDSSKGLSYDATTAMLSLSLKLSNSSALSVDSLFQDIKSLNEILSRYVPLLDTTIQKEDSLRAFYETVLVLDEKSEGLITWVLDDTIETSRTGILVEYLKTANLLKSVSSYGLKRLSRLLKDERISSRLYGSEFSAIETPLPA